MQNRHYVDRLQQIRQRMSRKRQMSKIPNRSLLQTPISQKFQIQSKNRAKSRSSVKVSKQARQNYQDKKLNTKFSPRWSELAPYRSRQSFSTTRYKNNSMTTTRRQSTPIVERQTFQYVMRFSFRTKKGILASNQIKTNQDSIVNFPQINKLTWQHYFGVCDGHGLYGHFVSAFIKENLPKSLLLQKDLKSNPIYALCKAFKYVQQKLYRQSKIDISFSGSTCIGLYLIHNKVYCVNVGDSRALLIKKKDGIFVPKQLSRDHKPDLPQEKARILSKGGRVEAFKDSSNNLIGPARVWVKEQMYPGLAMSRSFGDLVGSSVGVICEPEISQHSLSQQDKILLVGSDGVFEFLNNTKITEILGRHYPRDIQGGCDELLEAAKMSWSNNCNIMDDISFTLLFMQY